MPFAAQYYVDLSLQYSFFSCLFVLEESTWSGESEGENYIVS